ncbi:uncharacterized protein V1516DRAFT_683075 [Lipomyces oligophaga]|uniref:uncharacterized protein n=1 Tax=Lipomyces oligophaga TaxID=45792 RepID=UPI0034CFDAFF
MTPLDRPPILTASEKQGQSSHRSTIPFKRPLILAEEQQQKALELSVKFRQNPYATMISTPIRACIAYNLRLPKDLLLSLSLYELPPDLQTQFKMAGKQLQLEADKRMFAVLPTENVLPRSRNIYHILRRNFLQHTEANKRYPVFGKRLAEALSRDRGLTTVWPEDMATTVYKYLCRQILFEASRFQGTKLSLIEHPIAAILSWEDTSSLQKTRNPEDPADIEIKKSRFTGRPFVLYHVNRILDPETSKLLHESLSEKLPTIYPETKIVSDPDVATEVQDRLFLQYSINSTVLLKQLWLMHLYVGDRRTFVPTSLSRESKR